MKDRFVPVFVGVFMALLVGNGILRDSQALTANRAVAASTETSWTAQVPFGQMGPYGKFGY
jgi:hypothetical protein